MILLTLDFYQNKLMFDWWIKMDDINWFELRISISRKLENIEKFQVAEAIKTSDFSFEEEEGCDYDDGGVSDYWHGYIAIIIFHEYILPLEETVIKIILNTITNATTENVFDLKFYEAQVKLSDKNLKKIPKIGKIYRNEKYDKIPISQEIIECAVDFIRENPKKKITMSDRFTKKFCDYMNRNLGQIEFKSSGESSDNEELRSDLKDIILYNLEVFHDNIPLDQIYKDFGKKYSHFNDKQILELVKELITDKTIEATIDLPDGFLKIKRFPHFKIIETKRSIKPAADKVKSFSNLGNLVIKLDTLIEPFKEKEDILYSFITEKLCLPKEQDAKNVCKIIINKGLSRFPIFDTGQGIRKQVIKKKQDDISNMKVLLLGSNCKGLKEVLVSKEFSKIRKEFVNSSIQFLDAPHIKRDDIYEKLSEFKPQIVHFSGHGTYKTGPLFDGDEFLINTPPPLIDQLINVLKKGNEYIKLIIFNVCESSTIAEKVSKFIDYAIGIEGIAEDECVVAFSKGFYRILLNRDSIKNAFDNGTNRFFTKHTGTKADGLKRPYRRFSKNPGSLGEFTETFKESQDAFTENQRNLILKLGELRDKIHSNHPFENIKVRYMDSDFYKYMDTKRWNSANDQIKYKLKREIEHLNDLMHRLTSIITFLGLQNHLKDTLNSDEPRVTDMYSISPEKLAYSMAKGSEQYKNDSKRHLEDQFYNIGYLAGNFTTIFSEDGIYIFLDDDDILQAEKIKQYFISLNKYTNEFIQSQINLDEDDLKVEKILEISIKLIEKIDSEQIKNTLRFISKIYANLRKNKRLFENF